MSAQAKRETEHVIFHTSTQETRDRFFFVMGKWGVGFYQIQELIKHGRNIKRCRDKKAGGLRNYAVLRNNRSEDSSFLVIANILCQFPVLSIRIDSLWPHIYHDGENRQLPFPINK